MKKIKMVALVALSMTAFSASAGKVNTEKFLECFTEKINEIVAERAEAGIDKKKRMCDKLSLKTAADIRDTFLYNDDNGRTRFYNIDDSTLNEMYDYIKDDVDCYALYSPGQSASLAGAFLNAPTYTRNINLASLALGSVFENGEEHWDNAYKKLEDLGDITCK
ncbi:hypothetical protein A9Q84_14235 [Halobacteriovorax marinus]|uniref:Uncharacterized protein n=1 Tax=Halobacteriovorax marinus TaxID=97084 RepID=A0A1Y5FB83_9BACT|nr:hypothetical protein A9Q84_14235 [Halobacteriovorax marinus]